VKSFYFLMAGDGGQLEALQPYKIREFPTLIWYSQGLEVKRWAGFFPDPDPEVRLARLSAILRPLVSL
jgi:hypothetical protein